MFFETLDKTFRVATKFYVARSVIITTTFCYIDTSLSGASAYIHKCTADNASFMCIIKSFSRPQIVATPVI